jgi:UDP-N-acetylglucosamine 4,6-dehydratase
MRAGRIEGARVLVTGGTGSIGAEIVRQLLPRKPAKVIIFSRDDSKHFHFQQELAPHANVEFMIGDVRDRESLERAFQKGVDIVVHAAALKHVLICEQNPTEAVKTNILGTQNVVDLAKGHGVGIMMMVSTDKAVSPTSTMGASKFVAERLTIDGNVDSDTKCACVRFGNVLGSRGSVIPAFVRGIRERQAVWVSDLEVTRFAMPIPEAARLVLDAVEMCNGGEIFVLRMKAFSLRQLLGIIQSMPFAAGGFAVEERGLIRSEKLHEDLVSSDEVPRLWQTESHWVVAPPFGDWTPVSGAVPAPIEAVASDAAERYADDELRAEIDAAIARMPLD